MRLSLRRLVCSLERQEHLIVRVASSLFAVNSDQPISIKRGALRSRRQRNTYLYRGRRIGLVNAEYVYQIGVHVQRPRDVFVIRRGEQYLAVAVDEILEKILFVDNDDLRDVHLCFDKMSREPWAAVGSKGDSNILLLPRVGIIVQ